jgi:hypothetical protein
MAVARAPQTARQSSEAQRGEVGHDPSKQHLSQVDRDDSITSPSFKPRTTLSNRRTGLPTTSPWQRGSRCMWSLATDNPALAVADANWAGHGAKDGHCADETAASTSRSSMTRPRCQTISPRSRRLAPAPPLCSQLPSSSAPGARTTTMTTCNARPRTPAGASLSV